MFIGKSFNQSTTVPITISLTYCTPACLYHFLLIDFLHCSANIGADSNPVSPHAETTEPELK